MMSSSPRQLAAVAATLVLTSGAGLAAAPNDSPTPLLIAQGIERYQAGHFMAAARLLRLALARDSSNLAAGHYLGLALIRGGEKTQGRRVLRRIARQHPYALRLQFDLGLAYLQEDNASWALRTLSTARQLAVEQVERGLLREIDYFVGVAQLRMKNGRAAVAAFRNARPPAEVDPDSLRLRRALAYQVDGRFFEARAQADRVRGRLSPLGRRLLRSAYRAEGINAAWISYQLLAEMYGDSNPLYEHETSVGGSPALAIGGDLTVRPWLTSRSRFSARLSGRVAGYLAEGAEPGPDQANSGELGAQLRLAHRLGHKRPMELSIGYSFTLVALEGDPPLADENGVFIERHGGHAAMDFRAGRTQVQLLYRFARTAFARRVRSNFSQELSLWFTRPLWGERLRLLGWVGGRSELADALHYEALIPTAGVGSALLSPWKVMLGTRIGYELRHYYASRSAYGSARTDHVVDLTLEVGRSFGPHFTPRLVYRLLHNASTVQSFDYQRHVFGLQLVWRHD